MFRWLRLTLALFLLMIVTRLAAKAPSKTTASKKDYALQARFEAAYATSAPVVTPIAAAGNATKLATLDPQPSPTKLTSTTIADAGDPSADGFAGSQLSYMIALANIVNEIKDYATGNVPSAVNGIYDTLQTTNIFT